MESSLSAFQEPTLTRGDHETNQKLAGHPMPPFCPCHRLDMSPHECPLPFWPKFRRRCFRPVHGCLDPDAREAVMSESAAAKSYSLDGYVKEKSDEMMTALEAGEKSDSVPSLVGERAIKLVMKCEHNENL